MQYCSASSSIGSRFNKGKAPARAATAVIGALLLASALLAQPVASCAATVASVSSPTGRALLTYSHLPPVVSRLSPLGRTDGAQPINISFALKPRNADQIAPLLAAISDPKSLEYGRYLTQADYRARFGPTQNQVQAVVDYAKANGLTVTHVSPSGLLVRASGTATQMEAAFGVQLLDYVSPDARDNGRIFHAPNQEPMVSAAIAPLLTGILGLDSAGAPRNSLRGAPAPSAASGIKPQAALDSTGHAGLSPYDVANLYSLNTSLKTYSGKNQVLGLLEFDRFYASDIAMWESSYPLTTTFPAITPVSVDDFDTSGTPNDFDDQAEVTSDIDLMLNVAYNATQIRVYEADISDNYVDLIDAMANDSTPASVLSASWYIPETELSQAYVQSEANVLQQLALQGQTFCACSADSGAYTDESDDTPNAADPATQQTVVGVGGTDLTDSYNAAGTAVVFDSETSWYDPNDTGRGSLGTGGGGGISQYWSIPSWQEGAFSASVNPQGSTTMRNVPDVSLYGDYDTGGYDLYITDTGSGSAWYYYNGTSSATPFWAGMLADVNQERIAAGKPVLGEATPQIYALAESSSYATDFYDVDDNSTNGYFKAVKGYDNSTGWGTPLNGSQLITDLGTESATADFKLAVSPTSVNAGATVTGTVTLPQPAYVSETFTLTSSNSAALSVPATVVVGAGSSTATFTATAGSVSSSANVTVTAALHGYSAAASVTVNGTAPSGPTVREVLVSPASVQGGTAATTANRVYLTSAPTANVSVALTSSNTAVATVPSTVTIDSGSTSHTFTITTKAVTSTQTVTITAKYNGSTQTATLTVTPPPSGLKSVTLSPTSTEGGTSTTANRVYWTGNAPANETVTLKSSNTAVATVPSTVTIDSGSSSHTFTITTKAVTTQQTVTITATSGGVTQTATLTVTP